MGPRYEVNFVCLVELRADVTTEQVPCSPWAEAPPVYLFGVRPQQITHRPIVWHLLFAVYCADLKRNTSRCVSACIMIKSGAYMASLLCITTDNMDESVLCCLLLWTS